MSNQWNSRVDVLYINERLHDALDSANLAQEISDLKSELAHNFKVDAGITVGEALGWGDSKRRDAK